MIENDEIRRSAMAQPAGFNLGLAVNRLGPVEKQNNLSGMCAAQKGNSSRRFRPVDLSCLRRSVERDRN
jgi:hypothetical protein